MSDFQMVSSTIDGITTLFTIGGYFGYYRYSHGWCLPCMTSRKVFPESDNFHCKTLNNFPGFLKFSNSNSKSNSKFKIQNHKSDFRVIFDLQDFKISIFKWISALSWIPECFHFHFFKSFRGLAKSGQKLNFHRISKPR